MEENALEPKPALGAGGPQGGDRPGRRQLEETLRENAESFHAIVENAHAGYFRIGLDGRFQYVNDAWLRMHGYDSAEEVLGQHFSISQVAKDLPRAADVMAQLAAGSAVPHGTFSRRRKDGSVGYHTFSARPVQAQGRIAYLEGFLIDQTERFQLEGALRASEAKFSAIFQASPYAIHLTRLDDGIIRDLNSGFTRLYGYSREEALGRSTVPGDLGIWVHAADRQRFLVALDVGRTVAGFEAPLRRKDGSVFTSCISSSVVEIAGEHYDLSMVEDITGRRQQEQDREEALRLVNLVNAPSAFRTCMAELTAGLQARSQCEAVGIRLRVGEDYPYFETHGLPASFVAAENRLCALDQEGGILRDAGGNPLLECMCGNVLCGRFNPDLPFFTANGSFWTNGSTDLLASVPKTDLPSRTRNRCNGEGYESVALVPLRAGQEAVGLIQFCDRRADRFTPERIAQLEKMAGSLANALARRRAEEALRQSEERFRLAMAATEDGLWDWDITTGKAYLSPSCLRMLGYGPGEIPNRMEAWLEQVDPEDRARVVTAKQECIAGLAPAFEAEYRLRTKDGGSKWILGRGMVVDHDGQGRALRMVGTHVDITERKRAETEIRRLNEELEQRVRERTTQLERANKEMEAFSYSVSHDLRAPLRSIDGFSQVLLEDCQDQLDENGKHHLSRIRLGARRMGQLIDDLLRLSRIDRNGLSSADVDLSGLCAKVVEDLVRADPGRRVPVAIQPGMAVRADPRLILLVFENLLGNAWKFTGRRDDPRIEVGATRSPQGERVFFVRDNGAGFDMAFADKLFKAFQRLHSASEFEGTGIGLAIVQRIIHRHRGRVWGESEPDRGATFFFTLPD